MHDQMEFFGDGTDALQDAAQQDAEVANATGLRETCALEGGVVHAWQDPGFVRHAGRVRTEGDVVATHFDDAQALPLFLPDDVAEHATFFLLVVVPAGTQFVQHTARDEGGGGELRRGMFEFLAGVDSEILEDADVLDARVALEILDPLGGEAEELLDLGVACIPEVAIVLRVFDQDFVGLLRLIGKLGRNVAFFPFAVANSLWKALEKKGKKNDGGG